MEELISFFINLTHRDEQDEQINIQGSIHYVMVLLAWPVVTLLSLVVLVYPLVVLVCLLVVLVCPLVVLVVLSVGLFITDPQN